MGNFLTVVVLLAVVGAGVFLIRRLRNQRSERIDVFPYGRSRTDVREPAPSATHKTRSRAGASGTDDRPDHRDDGRARPPARSRAGVPEK
ncbi:hypothetical protein [Streptomyces xylophagus]|uniref:hypothetical protein n=1 Tax=Streptomyces xylophagus TaxID=285514 RepID=UPI0005B9A4F8|nr:hypothetical protein [Streptomyces xylophagus]